MIFNCNFHVLGWINITSFFIVKNILDLIVPTINTITCCLICYLMTQQILTDWRFILFIYAQLAGVYCAQSFGFMIGIISVFNDRFINVIIPASYIILIIFSGFLVPIARIQPWMQVISNISFLKQSFEVTLISLYGMNRCDTAQNEYSFVLDEYGIYTNDVFTRDSLILLTHIIVWRLIFWIILVSKVNKKKVIDRIEVDRIETEDILEEHKGIK